MRQCASERNGTYHLQPIVRALGSWDTTKMIFIIDNYDSFTYNLVQRLGELDPTLEIEVYRNDQISPEEIERRSPSHLE